jgi:hypothetical protein
MHILFYLLIVVLLVIICILLLCKRKEKICNILSDKEKEVLSKKIQNINNNNSLEFDTYIISLKDRQERRKHIQEHMKNFNYEYSFFDAIRPKDEELIGQKLPKGKLGCSLSHRALWLKILTENKNILILEDDIYIKDWDRLHLQIKDLLNNRDKWEMVFLGHCDEIMNKKRHKFGDFYKSVRPVCRHAYFVSPIAAYKLLKYTNLCGHGDHQLRKIIRKKLVKSISAFPSVVIQSRETDKIPTFESDLEKKNNNGKVIYI